MNALATYRTLLSNQPLTRLLLGEFVSSIGDWLYLVALLIVVYQRSGDPVVLGLVAAARVLPYVFLSIPAGIAADRFDRKMILLVTDLLRGAIMVALAWLVATDGPLAAIVALSILATCFSCFFGPAIGSYIPALVRDESELGPANSAWSTLDNLAFVIGPAIAGLLIATTGLTVAFLLNAISFAIVAAVLATLPGAKAGRAEPTGEGAAPQADGWSRELVKPLVGLATMNVIASLVFGGIGVLIVVLASGALGAGEAGTGFLNAGVGVGGVLGGIVAGILVLRRRLGGPMILGGILFGVGVAALGVSTGVVGLVLALLAITMASAGNLIVDILSTTVFQRLVPDSIRGRGLGMLATAGTLSFAIGALGMPILVERFGATPVLAATGLAVAIGTAIAVGLVGPALERSPELEAALVRVRDLPIFSTVSPPKLEAALRQFTPLEVPAGTVVIRQGEPADRFYVITDGEFEVTQQQGHLGMTHQLRVMGPDEVFGELGLLNGAPRSATVTARTAGRLLALDGPDFLELVAAGPGLATRLLEVHHGQGRAAGAALAEPEATRALSGS